MPDSKSETTNKLPCGGMAYPDPDSTIGAYVCMDCLCVVGSMSMPVDCRELMEAADGKANV